MTQINFRSSIAVRLMKFEEEDHNKVEEQREIEKEAEDIQNLMLQNQDPVNTVYQME